MIWYDDMIWYDSYYDINIKMIHTAVQNTDTDLVSFGFQASNLLKLFKHEWTRLFAFKPTNPNLHHESWLIEILASGFYHPRLQETLNLITSRKSDLADLTHVVHRAIAGVVGRRLNATASGFSCDNSLFTEQYTSIRTILLHLIFLILKTFTIVFNVPFLNGYPKLHSGFLGRRTACNSITVMYNLITCPWAIVHLQQKLRCF